MNHTAALAIFALILSIVIPVTLALTTAPHAMACQTARAELSAARTPAEVDRAVVQVLAICGR